MSNVQVIEHREIAERPANAALTPMDMLGLAVTKGADIAVLEKLMALHERWEAGQARKAFDAAVADAKGEIPAIIKNREVDFKSPKGHTHYAYEDLATIAKVIDPILHKHGLSYRFRADQDGQRLSVTCVLSHRDGYSEATTLQAAEDHSGNKNSIQAIGSATTYLQRYTLKLALGLSTTKDDDGRAAGGTPAQQDDDDGPTLSDEQIKQIEDAIVFKGVNRDKFLKYVLKVSALENVYATKFETILKMIRESGAAQ